MNTRITKLLPFIFAPMLIGCAGSTMVISDKTTSLVSSTNMTGTSISFSCQKSNGEIIYQIVVSEKTALTISSDVKLSEGSVTFTVTYGDEQIYDGSISESANFEIPLKEYGKHRIKINHTNFKGSYALNWAKKE